MSRRALSLFVALFCLGMTAQADVLFYGGDFNARFWYSDSLSNENDAAVHGDPYGSAVYQNFVVPVGQIWNVTALFSNDIMSLTPISVYWEIRTGVSEGNGGYVLASGEGSDSYHLKGDYEEYTNTVSGLNLSLKPRMYWFSVIPEAPGQQGRSYNTNTFGENSVGTQITNEQYFDSPFYSDSFTNTDNIGVFPQFSDGVIGTAVPEPTSLLMLASGLIAAAGGMQRRETDR